MEISQEIKLTKILFLDWDGPVSNSRTWKMPNHVDPVAIQLLNDADKAGWEIVISSTIRKHDCDTAEKARKFLDDHGIHTMLYDFEDEGFRTDPVYTAPRHLEIANHLMHTDYPENTIFLVVDDEHIPHDFLDSAPMKQIYARSDSGIDYLSISDAYRIFSMSDEQLAVEFGLVDEDDE